jgi:hypothetical protein
MMVNFPFIGCMASLTGDFVEITMITPNTYILGKRLLK